MGTSHIEAASYDAKSIMILAVSALFEDAGAATNTSSTIQLVASISTLCTIQKRLEFEPLTTVLKLSRGAMTSCATSEKFTLATATASRVRSKGSNDVAVSGRPITGFLE